MKVVIYNLGFVILLLFASPAHAARLYFDAPKEENAVGQIFPVEVRLDTENQEINAVTAVLNLPVNASLADFSDGGSVINFWIQKPKIGAGQKIYFSGVAPAGFSSQDSFLIKLFLKAEKEGADIISFSKDSRVLLNDGVGTEAKLQFTNHELQITNKSQITNPNSQNLFENDKFPPEEFSPQIAKDESLFDGKYFLVFSAQDKDSGMDRYEVKENNEWVVAKSPYVLRDQSLKSLVYVKAVDRAGNERMVIVNPGKSTVWHKAWWFWGIIILSIIIATREFFKFKVKSSK